MSSVARAVVGLSRVVAAFVFSVRAAAASMAVDAPVPSGADVIVLEDQRSEQSHALLVASLRELLRRLDLRLVTQGPAPEAGVLAHVSVEPAEDAVMVRVSSTRSAAPPVFYRVERTADELLSETLAHVIFGAIEPERASLDSIEAPERDAAPEPVPESEEERSATTTEHAWWLGARGGPTWSASNRVGAVLAASVGGTLLSAWRPSAALEAVYWVPTRVTRDAVQAELSRFGGRLRARAEPFVAERVALQLGLSGGADLVSVASPSTQGSKRLQPLLGGSIAGLLRVAADIDLVMSAGIDVELAPRRWSIVSGTERSRIFETASLLPYAALGFEWRMAGAEPDPTLVQP